MQSSAMTKQSSIQADTDLKYWDGFVRQKWGKIVPSFIMQKVSSSSAFFV
jgi:hypothetical protein